MSKPSEQLAQKLGFNPVRREPITQTVLSKVLEEVKAERLKEAEVRATAIVKQALEIAQKMDAARKAFTKAETAFEKELGGLLGQLGGQQTAEPQPEVAEATTPPEQSGQ